MRVAQALVAQLGARYRDDITEPFAPAPAVPPAPPSQGESSAWNASRRSLSTLA